MSVCERRVIIQERLAREWRDCMARSGDVLPTQATADMVLTNPCTDSLPLVMSACDAWRSRWVVGVSQGYFSLDMSCRNLNNGRRCIAQRYYVWIIHEWSGSQIDLARWKLYTGTSVTSQFLENYLFLDASRLRQSSYYNYPDIAHSLTVNDASPKMNVTYGQ